MNRFLKLRKENMTHDYYFPENPRHRCCCECCHVRTGSIAIAVVGLLLSAYFLVKGIVFLVRNHGDYRYTAIVTVALTGVCVVIALLLLFGVLKEIALMLIPYLIAQVLVIIISFTMAVLCAVYLIAGYEGVLGPTGAVDQEPVAYSSSSDQTWLHILVGVALAVYLLVFALGIWFFIVVLHCFRWMKERKAYRGDQDLVLNDAAVANARA